MTDKEKQLYQAAKATFNSWPKWKQEAAMDFMNSFKKEPDDAHVITSCLNPFERNELKKAMLGRGVDYETIQLILKDFDARIKHLEYLGSLRVCPICGKIAGFNSYFQAFYCTSCGYLWK